MPKKRIDVLLTQKKLVETRALAKTLILAGKVYLKHKRIEKASELIDEQEEIILKQNKLPYVSRAGMKLKALIDECNIKIKGKVCADIGTSTGGFADCLIKEGAKKVYCVDTGRGQIHNSLRTDKKIILLENTNARYLNGQTLPEKVNLISVDVSFISVKKIIPALKTIAAPLCGFLILIKPQFEAPRGSVKKGVIKDGKIKEDVLKDIRFYLKEEGLKEKKNYDFSR